MKIFWSWQSETPGKTGRHFVRAALLEAIERLKQPEGEVEEPTQAENRESMHLDQDRQGVTGSPGLADTIKKKIEAAAVFIADITPVSKVPMRKGVKDSREKRNMNPNVAIELGYALHALKEERVLLVLNTVYGGREFIPFDLQHLGGPIMYSLAADASKDEITAAQSELTGQFVTALRGFLKADMGTADEPAFPSVAATTSPAVWFEPGEVLAEFDRQTQYEFDDDKGVYLKVSPRKSLSQPFTTSQLYNLMQQSRPGVLHKQQTGFVRDNSYGAVFMEPVSGSGGRLRAATQVFRNGEIWGFGPDLLVDNQIGRVIPVQLLEMAMREALIRNIDFMKSRLEIAPPYRIEFGATGIKGYSLAINTDIDNPYEIRDDVFSNSFVITDTTPAGTSGALLRIYEAFFRLTGYPRPPNLFGFPSQSTR